MERNLGGVSQQGLQKLMNHAEQLDQQDQFKQAAKLFDEAAAGYESLASGAQHQSVEAADLEDAAQAHYSGGEAWGQADQAGSLFSHQSYQQNEQTDNVSAWVDYTNAAQHWENAGANASNAKDYRQAAQDDEKAGGDFAQAGMMPGSGSESAPEAQCYEWAAQQRTEAGENNRAARDYETAASVLGQGSQAATDLIDAGQALENGNHFNAAASQFNQAACLDENMYAYNAASQAYFQQGQALDSANNYRQAVNAFEASASAEQSSGVHSNLTMAQDHLAAADALNDLGGEKNYVAELDQLNQADSNLTNTDQSGEAVTQANETLYEDASELATYFANHGHPGESATANQDAADAESRE